MKQKIILAAISSAILISPLSYAKNAKGASNGQPFKALQTQIDANTAAIESNQSAIANNAASIDSLSEDISSINAQIDVIESRLTQNEQDIVVANQAIQDNQTAIADLTISISANIMLLESEINSLKTTVGTLGVNLASLQEEVDAKTNELRSAIASNASDISALTAIVSVMTADLNSAQTNITSLLSRISGAEAIIADQSSALSNIDQQLNALDVRVTALEEGAAKPNGRTITFNGTAANDYSLQELRNMVASLNVTTDDWVLFKGQNSYGTTQLCSADNNVINAMNAFVNGNSYYNYASATNNTYTQNYQSSTWMSANYLYTNSYVYTYNYTYSYTDNYLNIYANGSSFAQFLLRDMTDSYYSNDNLDVYVYPTWDIYENNSLTITAAATRLEACGF